MEFVNKICELTSKNGLSDELSLYKKKRLFIFNSINIFGFLLAICWFINATFLSKQQNTLQLIALNLVPCIISLCCIVLVNFKQYKIAIYINTLLIPITIFISNIYLQEGSVLLYLTIYLSFPFFFHSKFHKILVHYLFIVLLYALSIYMLNLHHPDNKIIFTAWLQIAEFIFFFAVFFLVKKQVVAYENLLKRNKEILDIKNEEMIKLLTLKDQILSVIAHDIMVPLNSMKTISNQIIDDNYDRASMEEFFPIMNDEIAKTKNLFSNLLDWSKAQLEGKGKDSEDVNIHEVVDLVYAQINKLAKSKNIKIVNDIDKNIMANVNRGNLMVAIRNIMVNAIKFTNKDGAVTLYTSKVAGFVQLNITDTGIGMSEEVKKKIFADDIYTTFGTNMESGNGFGLKISRELIKQNGGNVFCENSYVGIGTTFAIKMKSNNSLKLA